jgi:hypothetical protein
MGSWECRPAGDDGDGDGDLSWFMWRARARG